MEGIDPLNPVYLGTLAGAWMALFLLTVILGSFGRHRAYRPSMPMDAPAPLDPYGLACLAGGAQRLREAALAAVVVRLRRPQTELTATVPPASELVTTRPAAGGGPAHDPPHPVEEAMRLAQDKDGPGSADSFATAQCLASGYTPELERLNLLADSSSWLWFVPAGITGVMLIALSIGSIIVAATNKQADGNRGPVDGVIIASAFVLIASFMTLAASCSVKELNWRGERILAQARERNAHLIPKGRHWSALTPSDLALSVALFGLAGWAGFPPLKELHARLYPPSTSDGG